MWTNYIRFKSNSTYEDTLQQWLKMNITICQEPMFTEDNKKITHKEYVNYFINIIKSILSSNNYVIINENKFKDEITNFIYTLSDNSKHG